MEVTGYLRKQVRLSWGETNVPEGQLSTHFPFDKKKPGKHPVHWAKSTVDAPLKFGILQEVHLASQANEIVSVGQEEEKESYTQSHSFLLLSAMSLEPSQTPSEFAATQAPLNENRPDPQMMQSFDVPPVHVSQDESQGVHDVPPLKLPSGHIVPVDVMDRGGLHFVRSLGFCVNPALHVMQAPVPSAHCVHPSWHTRW